LQARVAVASGQQLSLAEFNNPTSSLSGQRLSIFPASGEKPGSGPFHHDAVVLQLSTYIKQWTTILQEGSSFLNAATYILAGASIEEAHQQ
jgi:hypothetical protein